MTLPRLTWRKIMAKLSIWAFWLIVSLAVIVGLTNCGGRG